MLLLYGASATFVQLHMALNRIFDPSADSVREQSRTTVIGRLLGALFVVLIGVLDLAVIGFNVMLSRLADQINHLGWLSLDLLRVLRHFAQWLVVRPFFAGLLKYLPMRSLKWRHVLPGALVSLILFQIGKYVIGWYLSRAIITSAYRASSSLVAIMIWIHRSSQTLLPGPKSLITQPSGTHSKRSSNPCPTFLAPAPIRRWTLLHLPKPRTPIS